MPTAEKSLKPLVPGHLLRDAVSIVEGVHVSFLQVAEVTLSDLLQTPATLAFQAASQSPFVEVASSDGPDHLVPLDLKPIEGTGFLAFPQPLLFRVLDILLATPEIPADSSASARTVTGIELYILREFFEVFAQALRKAWEPIYPVSFGQAPDAEESEPADLPEGLALVLKSSISIGGSTEIFSLILPAYLARLVHMKAKESAGRVAAPAPPPALVQSLGNATVRLDAVLDGRGIRIGDLLDLAPGQILMAGDPDESPFGCLINGEQGFTGELVASNGRCAIQVETLPDD